MLRRALIAGLLTLLTGAGAEAARVHYTLTVRANNPVLHVQARVEDAEGPTVTMAMPAWVPGYYRRLDLYRNVSNVAFTTDGAAVTPRQSTSSTWSVDNTPGQAVTVDYDVRALDDETTLGMMTAHVGRDKAYVHPGAVFMYLDGQDGSPCTLKIQAPKGWDIATPMTRAADGSFSAPDYDTLNDSPIQMGAFKRIPFQTRGRDFEIITSGKCRVSDAALRDVCRRTADATIDLFGGWIPFERYQFHFHASSKKPTPGPGLEHGSSTVIVLGSRDSDKTIQARPAGYISHEFIHAWNVKALRPEGLGPFDYQKEAITPSLWMAEGLTSYYQAIVLARAGVWDPDNALGYLEYMANEYLRSSGRNRTSLSESSLTVWSNGYSSGGGGTNYYEKGAIAAWLLDVEIRAETAGRRSLDDALRWMSRRYAEKDVPYPPDALLAAIREATGTDVSDLYRRVIHGTEDLPLADTLRKAGLSVNEVEEPNLVLGVEFESSDREPVVRRVEGGSAAEKAHIEVGDVILRVDGKPVRSVNPSLLEEGDHRIGDRVEILVRRNGQETPIIARIQSERVTHFRKAPGATTEQRAIWEGLWGKAAVASRQ